MRPMLTIDDLASILNISYGSVRNLAMAGKIPGAMQVGRNWRFNPDAVQRWLAESQKPKE
jgi:excisionase family DNA binding protein